MKRALIAICCALASVSCSAGDWVAGGASDDVDQFIDYSSIETNNKVRGTWLLRVVNHDKNGVAYSIVWTEFNCQQKKERFVDYVDYDSSDNNIESGSEPTRWSRVIPGTIGETALKAVCSKVRPKVIFPDTDPKTVATEVRKYRTSTGDWK